MFAWGLASPLHAASGPEEKGERGPAGPFREGDEVFSVSLRPQVVREPGTAHSHAHTPPHAM